MTFRYQWLRCSPDATCQLIRGAIGQTYTVTKVDAVTDTSGSETEISVFALGSNSVGNSWTPDSVLRYVAIEARLARPPSFGSALEETVVMVGTAGELPQLRANSGLLAATGPATEG